MISKGVVRGVFPTLVAVGMALLVACGQRQDANVPPSEGSSANPGATSAASAPSSATTSTPIPASRRKPFEVYNACHDVANIAFGGDGRAEQSKQTIAPFSTLEGARDEEGKQTVWLLDEKREPLVKVIVTRTMKRVEIGRSCRTLDAR